MNTAADTAVIPQTTRSFTAALCGFLGSTIATVAVLFLMNAG